MYFFIRFCSGYKKCLLHQVNPAFPYIRFADCHVIQIKSTKIIDFVKSISPVDLTFDIDDSEKVNHLNADISLLNKILNLNE
jgi:hypothetical protein